MNEETSGISKVYSGKYITKNESDDEGLTKEEMVGSGRPVIIKWEESYREIENLKNIVRELHQENKNLSTTVTSQGEDTCVLTYKLEELAKFVRILNKSQNMSDRIMEDDKKSRTSDEFLIYTSGREEAKKLYSNTI